MTARLAELRAQAAAAFDSLAAKQAYINGLEADLESAEKAIELARDLLEWTCDDDWWCEPGFPEARDAWLKWHEAKA